MKHAASIPAAPPPPYDAQLDTAYLGNLPTGTTFRHLCQLLVDLLTPLDNVIAIPRDGSDASMVRVLLLRKVLQVEPSVSPGHGLWWYFPAEADNGTSRRILLLKEFAETIARWYLDFLDYRISAGVQALLRAVDSPTRPRILPTEQLLIASDLGLVAQNPMDVERFYLTTLGLAVHLASYELPNKFLAPGQEPTPSMVKDRAKPKPTEDAAATSPVSTGLEELAQRLEKERRMGKTVGNKKRPEPFPTYIATGKGAVPAVNLWATDQHNKVRDSGGQLGGLVGAGRGASEHAWREAAAITKERLHAVAKAVPETAEDVARAIDVIDHYEAAGILPRIAEVSEQVGEIMGLSAPKEVGRATGPAHPRAGQMLAPSKYTTQATADAELVYSAMKWASDPSSDLERAEGLGAAVFRVAKDRFEQRHETLVGSPDANPILQALRAQVASGKQEDMSEEMGESRD